MVWKAPTRALVSYGGLSGRGLPDWMGLCHGSGDGEVQVSEDSDCFVEWSTGVGAVDGASHGMSWLKTIPDRRVARVPNTGSQGNAMVIFHQGNPNWRKRSTAKPTVPPRIAASWERFWARSERKNQPRRIPVENPAMVNALSTTLCAKVLAHIPMPICRIPKKTVAILVTVT